MKTRFAFKLLLPILVVFLVYGCATRVPKSEITPKLYSGTEKNVAVGVIEARPLQAGAGEVGVIEDRVAQVGACQVGLREVGTACDREQPGIGKNRPPSSLRRSVLLP